MSSEAWINLCLIKDGIGRFSNEINPMLQCIFKGTGFTWNMREKKIDVAKMVIVEIKGSSEWQYEQEVVEFFENHANEAFWNYLQGYQITLYPEAKGCDACGTK